MQGCETDGVMGREVVIDTSLRIVKAKRQRRLIAKINSIENVLKIALSEIHKPGSAFLFGDRALQCETGIGRTDAGLAMNAIASSLPGLHVQHSRGAVGKSNRPGSLIKRHV